MSRVIVPIIETTISLNDLNKREGVCVYRRSRTDNNRLSRSCLDTYLFPRVGITVNYETFTWFENAIRHFSNICFYEICWEIFEQPWEPECR